MWAVSGDFRGTGVLSVIEVGATEAPPDAGDTGDNGDTGADPVVEIGAVAGVVGDDPIMAGPIASDPVADPPGANPPMPGSRDDPLIIVNRFGSDSVSLLDLTTRTLIAEVSTGPGSNPQDALLYRGRLYVAALAVPGLLVIDLERIERGESAAASTRTIDLATLDPDDGVPDCHAIARVEERLYVSCGVLDERFQPRADGRVAVIDVSATSGPDDDGSGQLIDTISLTTPNPIGRLHVTPSDGPLAGDLLVATVDFDGLTDNDLTRGCVERIAIGASPATSGCVVENAELGGYASSLVYDRWSQPGQLYVVTVAGYGPGGPISRVVRFDVQSSSLAEGALTAPEQAPIDVVQCPGGELVIADAASGGVRIYEPDAGSTTGFAERSADPLDVGLPPVERGMVCIPAPVTAATGE